MRRATQKQKTLRALDVYLEVTDTANWLRSWMRGPLESFDSTPQGLRMLVLLYREGPMRTVEAARALRFRRQNLDAVVGRLEERKWVKREIVTRPNPGLGLRPSKARSQTRKLRTWKIGVISLTPLGERFVARVLPNNGKVLKALMRALHGREQETLVEICQKLRAGAILKFTSELTHEDEWEEVQEAEEAEEAQEAEELQEAEETQEAEEAEEAEEAKEEEERQEEHEKQEKLRELEEKNRELLGRIARKMRQYDIVNAARNVDWDKPRDEEREAKNAVTMLMRVVNGVERKLLERMAAKLGNREVIKMVEARA